MTSIDPSRATAYSEDLRWRMIYQKEGLCLSYANVARNLQVDISTVKRTVKLWQRTGGVKKKPYPIEKSSRKITDILQFYILDLVLSKPSIYLHEIQREVCEEFCISLDCSSICRMLHKSGFTHQSLRITALQRNEDLRCRFCIEVSLYKEDMLVFVDETGFDRRNLIRNRGYSLRGKPAISKQLVVRGEHVSVIAAISSKGLLDLKIHRGGAVDSDIFCDFVTKQLLPHLSVIHTQWWSLTTAVSIIQAILLQHYKNAVL